MTKDSIKEWERVRDEPKPIKDKPRSNITSGIIREKYWVKNWPEHLDRHHNR